MEVSCKSATVSSLFPTYECFIDSLDAAPDECRSRALALEEGFEALETMDFEHDGTNFDSYDVIKPSTHAEPAQPSTGISRGPGVEINPGDATSPARSQLVSPAPSQSSQSAMPILFRSVSPATSRPVSLAPSRPVCISGSILTSLSYPLMPLLSGPFSVNRPRFFCAERSPPSTHPQEAK